MEIPCGRSWCSIPEIGRGAVGVITIEARASCGWILGDEGNSDTATSQQRRRAHPFRTQNRKGRPPKRAYRFKGAPPARDARLILDLLLAHRFPEIWVPTPAERDLRQLLRQRLTSETLWKTFSGVGRGLVPNPLPASIWDHFLSCSSLSALYRSISTPALFLF